MDSGPILIQTGHKQAAACDEMRVHLKDADVSPRFKLWPVHILQSRNMNYAKYDFLFDPIEKVPRLMLLTPYVL